MVSSFDFALGCIGVGTLLVCVAFSIKILSDVRLRAKASHHVPDRNRQPQHVAITVDPLEQRLHEARAQFGRPIGPGSPAFSRSHHQVQTWPVAERRQRLPIKPGSERANPDPDTKKTKNE